MSRTAILRAIGKGKISAKKNEHGEWDIDPAELHRVYPPQQNSTVNDNINPSNTNSSEIREIKAKLEAAEQRILDKDGVIDDLRRRLDQSEQERRDKDRQLTALLTDQRAKAPDVIAMPPASPPHVSPAPIQTEAPAATPADTGEQHYPARVVVKKAPAPKKTPKPEVGWWRKMIGGR